MASTASGSISIENLNAELQSYARQFSEAVGEADTLLAGLDDARFNWRPAENEWSVAEIMDHLIVIGHAMLPQFDDAMAVAEEKGWSSDGPFKYGILGNWFVTAVGPTDKARRRKFKAPPMYTPSSNHSLSRVSKSFAELQGKFIEKVDRANGLDLARIKIPSPAARILRLSLGQWFALLAGHQRRHFRQIEAVKSRFPPDAA